MPQAEKSFEPNPYFEQMAEPRALSVREQLKQEVKDRMARNPAIPLRFTEDWVDGTDSRK